MRLLACVLAFAAAAEARPHPKLKLAAQTVLVVVSTALDNRSSWVGSTLPGIHEANPLFSSNGKYRMKGLLLEDGLAAGALIFQWVRVGKLSHTPQLIADTGDVAYSASHLIVAAHNYSLIHKAEAK